MLSDPGIRKDFFSLQAMKEKTNGLDFSPKNNLKNPFLYLKIQKQYSEILCLPELPWKDP